MENGLLGGLLGNVNVNAGVEDQTIKKIAIAFFLVILVSLIFWGIIRKATNKN